MIAGIESSLRRWSEGVPQTRYEIRQVRRRLLTDADMERIAEKFELDWVAAFEDRLIQIRWCVIHGDLHGSNVLTSNSGQAVVVDYGDVGEGPASLDPITLELALLCHPQSPIRGGNWPTAENCEHWGDLDRYLVDCPCAEYVRSCREWAQRLAAGNREIAACAYSYLVRQLKYEDTDKGRVMSLLKGVKNLFEAT
jgi:aminoglycoside phosphotransferase (APT) family kinase protein